MSETQTTNGESATGGSAAGGSSSGRFTVKVPDVGEGVAEVEIVSWSVAVGDKVSRLQTVAEVMTDKATVEVPSPVDGVVAELGGAVGDVLLVGSPLIHLGLGGAEAASGAQSTAAKPPPPERSHRPSTATDVDAATDTTDDDPGSVDTGAPADDRPDDVVESSAARSVPRPPGVEARPHATGAPMSSSEPRPARATAASTSEGRGRSMPPSRTLDGKVLATPAVRRRARDNGVDLRRVGASGPAGRVTHEDLDAYLAARAESGLVAGTPAPSAPVARTARTGVTEQPLVGLRRRIARQMIASTSTIPHITYVEEIDMTALEELRATLNNRIRANDAQARLTLLPFLIRALTNVLVDFPQCNAHLDDSASDTADGGGAGVLRVYEGVHVGIATQTDNGLIVPVLSHAEAHTVWSAATAIAELTEATRTGRASVEDLSGSTITITSLGALGGVVSTPVINKPEVAIVGVNKMAVRPVWNEASGEFEPRKMMNLSSSFDHRVIDGWDAANFVQAVRTQLEQPALLFVDPIPGGAS